MPTDHTPPRSIAENDLAKLLGIERNVLREQRITHLQIEIHWFQKKSEVRLNEAGVRELCVRLDLEVPAAWQTRVVNPWTTASTFQFAPEKKDGAGDSPEPEPAPQEPEKTPAKKAAVPAAPRKKDAATDLPEGVLAVFMMRRAKRNPHIVFAQKKRGEELAGPEIPVRVRDAQAVAFGQELHIKITGSLGCLFGQQPRSQRQRLIQRSRPA